MLEMLCIGTGPGPKNVLARDEHGRVEVYSYREFKKRRYDMGDDSLYGSAIGFVQFDVEEDDANGATVRRVTIRSMNTGDLLRITVWPEHADTEIEKGDLVAVDGKVTIREVDDKTYVNMSAFGIVVLKPAPREEAEVVKKEKKASGGSTGRKTF